jgi:hypothetical protein
MSRRNTKPRKRRLQGRSYRHAEILADYLTDPDTEEKDREAISESVAYLSRLTDIPLPASSTGVRAWRKIRDAYIEMHRAVLDACDEALVLDKHELEPDTTLGLLYHTAQHVAALLNLYYEAEAWHSEVISDEAWEIRNELYDINHAEEVKAESERRERQLEQFWKDVASGKLKPKGQESGITPLSGESVEVDGQSIPIIGAIRFARELPRAVNTLCCAEPGQPVAFEDAKTTALYDTLCGEVALNLDLSRGCFVCAKHAGIKGHWYGGSQNSWILTLSDDLDHLVNLDDAPRGSQTWRAMKTLELIRRRARKLWRRERPLMDFETFFEGIWQAISEASTRQIRITTDRFLMRSNN